MSLSNQDQIFAVIGRFQRGRIDRAFLVDRSTLRRKLGVNQPIRLSLLNEAYEQVSESLANGSYQGAIYRLSTSAAAIKWAVWDASAAAGTAGTSWTVSTAAPTASYHIAIRHLECFNDGIVYDVAAAEKLDNSLAQVAGDMVTVRAFDPANGQVIMNVTGSLSPTATDEFGETIYLPDKVASLFPDWEVIVLNGATVPTASPAYGLDANGSQKVTRSATLAVFVEGSTTYANTDYDRAIAALQYSPLDFGYLISAGSRAPALLTRMAALGYAMNRHVKIDVPGEFTPAQAKTWQQQLQIDSEFVSFLWAPLIADLPSGGKGTIGTSGLHAGYSARRNAVRDQNGFAAKNSPVAGRNWPVNRSSIRQLYTPTEQELSMLADTKIIPVIFDRYNGGGQYVFADVLTSRKVQNSVLKLTSVAEMKSDLDEAITRQAKEYSFLPIATFISRMEAYLDALLTGAKTAGWLIPSKNLDGNAAFAYTVERSNISPADKVLIRYYTSYDGVARQVEVTQVLTR
ncbi:hypothetical protein [Nevskia ramosa]|uniref:hypothetical protein n=1 Tax=Nevskia ramosa TaxID=64002 RepID=UPI003D0A0359